MNETVISNLAKGIAKAEGFYVAGSLPSRANNPGDLSANIHWPGMTGHLQSSGQGATSIAVFDTVEHGWAALHTNLRTHITRNPDETLGGYIHEYCQATGPTLANYIHTVLAALGFGTAEWTLSQIANHDHMEEMTPHIKLTSYV